MIEFLTRQIEVPVWFFIVVVVLMFGGVIISLIMLFLTTTSGITLSWSRSFKRVKELFIKLKNAKKEKAKKKADSKTKGEK